MFKVAIVGGAGGVGQPLGLLLKTNSFVKTLCLFDVVPEVLGVAADLSHVNSPTQVHGFFGPLDNATKHEESLACCLKDADIVLITAGSTLKPGFEDRDALFHINARIITNIVESCCHACPNAKILIITNPVNSLVPAASVVMKKNGIKNWEHNLFGVTSLDVIRAITFVSEEVKVDQFVPVVGGHSGPTILPLFSQLKVKAISDALLLTRKVQQAGVKVYEAKERRGTATLSMAYAAARLATCIMQALCGEATTECCFVSMKGVDCRMSSQSQFFALPVTFNAGKGVDKFVHPLPTDLSELEKDLLENEVLPELKRNVHKGLSFQDHPTAKL